jgi:hypothetical protein
VLSILFAISNDKMRQNSDCALKVKKRERACHPCVRPSVLSTNLSKTYMTRIYRSCELEGPCLFDSLWSLSYWLDGICHRSDDSFPAVWLLSGSCKAACARQNGNQMHVRLLVSGMEFWEKFSSKANTNSHRKTIMFSLVVIGLNLRCRWCDRTYRTPNIVWLEYFH